MNWNQCRRLIIFEFKNTPVIYYLFNIAIALLIAMLFADILPGYLIEDPRGMGIDFIFLVGLCTSCFLFRFYSFSVRQLKGNLYIAPIQLIIRQFPIQHITLVISRLTTSILYGVLSSIVFLVLLGNVLPSDIADRFFPNFFSFSIVWVCFAIFLSAFVTASETGSHMSKTMYYLGMIFFIILLFFSSLVFRLITGDFIFPFILNGVINYPILFPIMIIILTIISVILTGRYILQQHKKADYHA
ncbi:hypothetical protein QA612_12700 [Evansella sp. AB-P1]|uniref:hypothetical protein n=1 Tax=Evansella sp. AB-P1 TaxID=3037653 RepID=UPI00241CAFE3|nr:hypothetical protein [Evansella sp. AB-P1]MDG5788342.1 hypothetical protein [Evansella sp. AB-P1]